MSKFRVITPGSNVNSFTTRDPYSIWRKEFQIFSLQKKRNTNRLMWYTHDVRRLVLINVSRLLLWITAQRDVHVLKLCLWMRRRDRLRALQIPRCREKPSGFPYLQDSKYPYWRGFWSPSCVLAYASPSPAKVGFLNVLVEMMKISTKQDNIWHMGMPRLRLHPR